MALGAGDVAPRGSRVRLLRAQGAALLATALTAGLLGVGVPAAVAAGPGEGASGVGDPYFPLDGNGGIDVVHYDVANRYDFASGLLVGRTNLTLRATQDLQRFNLDLMLKPTAVTVAGRKARFRKDGKHELVIRPATALKAGSTVTVVVRHRGKPKKLSYRGERSWFSDRHEVVAVNEPHIAPWWFAANDHPSDKATFAVSMSVPRGKEVISNGRLVKKVAKGKRVVWHWKARDPMATYLAFFVAGDFTLAKGSTRGLPWRVAVSKRLTKQQQRVSMAQLKKSAARVRWLEKHLGPYPFETTGGVAVSLPLGFALETQTRPVYPGFGHHDDALVIHELAHQWFGNSVSVRRWADIWLNEGLASFMEWRFEEARGELTGAETLEETYRWTPASDRFWKVRPGAPGGKHLFDWSVYSRGAMTVQALRNRIGEDAFTRLLQTWTQRHAGGNATVSDFETLAEEIGGQELDAFFTAWLRTPSKPARTVANGLVRP